MPASPTRVLVSHELTTYAEALATFLAHCCPDIQVRCPTPLDLEAAVLAAPGAIAVADRLTPAITAHAAGWLLFYPAPSHENVAILGGQDGGESERIEEPVFANIVAAIDRLAGRPQRLGSAPQLATPAP